MVQGVAEVWVLIVLAGQRLLPAAAHAQQLPLLAVTPLHSTVLKPNLDLVKQKQNVMNGLSCMKLAIIEIIQYQVL